MGAGMKKNVQVGFRLDDFHGRLLAKAARDRDLSPGEYARAVVTEALTDAARQRLLDEVAEVRREVGRLRDALATAVVALLTDAGKAEVDEAREFVRDHLLK
jgi:hypothetical protein